MRRSWLIALAAAFIGSVLYTALQAAPEETAPQAQIGNPAPGFTLNTGFNLADLSGVRW